MLFSISKLLPPLLMPLPLLLVLAGFLLVAHQRCRRSQPKADGARTQRLRRVGLGLLWSSYCLLLLSSLPVVADLLVRWWEHPRSTLDQLAEQPYDAALVLGGSLDPALSDAANLHYELGSAAERLTAALMLYNNGYALSIFYSGGSGNPWNQHARESPLAAGFFSQLGLPAEALLVEGNSRNTWENAVYSAPLLAEHQLHSILLITSALHMRRSLAIFRKQGIAVQPWTCDTELIDYPLPLALIPSARAMETTTKVLREIMGYLAYAVLGRL